MEQYENDGTQPEASEVEASTDTSSNESLEANETDNDNSTRESDGTPNSGQSLNQKLEELGLSREEYFKLKGQESSQESGESRQENSQQKVASDDALLGRLEARGVMDADDQDYVIKAANTLGISPIEALNDPVVKDRLAASEKARETAAATPSSSSRSGQSSAKETPEYWIDKAELPPKSNTELRRKVMHMKAQRKASAQMFNN